MSHFITIEGLIHQEDINIINVHASDNTVSKYMKQNLTNIEEKIVNSITTVGDLTPVSQQIVDLDKNQ